MFYSVVANQRQPQHAFSVLQRRRQPRQTIVIYIYVLSGGGAGGDGSGRGVTPFSLSPPARAALNQPHKRKTRARIMQVN